MLIAFKFLKLRIDQRIHWIHNNSGDAGY
jgi:hypothetical protein